MPRLAAGRAPDDIDELEVAKRVAVGTLDETRARVEVLEHSAGLRLDHRFREL